MREEAERMGCYAMLQECMINRVFRDPIPPQCPARSCIHRPAQHHLGSPGEACVATAVGRRPDGRAYAADRHEGGCDAHGGAEEGAGAHGAAATVNRVEYRFRSG